MSGRLFDEFGNPLILADSHTASNTFGFGGNWLLNVPKSKFLFYVKFYRPTGDGGSRWARGLGFSIKSIDRPKISFENKVLNQYNRKRIVQTGVNYENVLIRFHDTANDAVQRMFEEYFNFYYGDSSILGLQGPLYDITTAESQEQGGWGFKLPSPTPGDEYGYFFSHATIYQIYNNVAYQTDVVNPKIMSYDPDVLDYEGTGSSEITMSLSFEGLVYRGLLRLKDNPDLLEEMGLQLSQYYDVADMFMPEMKDPLENTYDPRNPYGSTQDKIDNILRRQTAAIFQGRGVSAERVGLDVLNTFDKSQGVATAKLGADSVGNLINGNVKKGLTGLTKLKVFGGPGDLF